MKLNRLLTLLLLANMHFSCETKQYNTDNMSDKKENINDKKGNLYGIEFNIKVPCEIRVNDMIVSKNYLSGVIGPEIINQYLVKSGDQKVKIKIFQPNFSSGNLFDNNALKNILEGTYIQTIEPENDYKVNIVKELKFPEINNKVSSFEYEWDFQADIPYNISSWEDAQDLSTIDKDILKKEVLEKYHELWGLLQSGQSDKFISEIEIANRDLFNTNYYDADRVNEYKSNLVSFYSNHKNAMLPINNSDMVLLANGKAVALEQVGEFKGFGLLLAKGQAENSIYSNYIILIKSKKTNKYKIQIINSEFLKYK